MAVVLPVLVVLVAVAITVVVSRGDGGGGPAGGGADIDAGATAPDPVAISSDAPKVADLAALVAASDVVVRGEVVVTERGRWFGAGDGSTRLESRFVTLRVLEVLAGTAPAGGTLLLEEEGWLEDGAPVIVDGAAPSRAGDTGIWFLVDGGDPEVGAHLMVSAQGRYLSDAEGHLTGAAGPDPLVAELASRSLAELAAEVRAT